MIQDVRCAGRSPAYDPVSTWRGANLDTTARRLRWTGPVRSGTISTMQDSDSSDFEVRTYFVRGRNALVARAEFTSLYVDYYLHLASQGLRHEPLLDQMLKNAIAAVTLHSASRPLNESVAWTIHFQQPLANLFVAAVNSPGRIIGNAFTENVKAVNENLLYSDVLRGSQPTRRSVVAFEGTDPFRAVEHLYRQSEQRPARYFEFDPEDFVMISAQPDCDFRWLETLDHRAIRELDERENLSLLERRQYRWQCGCDQKRIMEVLAPTMKVDPEALFNGEELVRAHCPRCGGRFVITREALEAFIAAV